MAKKVSFVMDWNAPRSLRRKPSLWRILERKAGGGAVNVQIGRMEFTHKPKGACFTASVKTEDGQPLPSWFDRLLDKRFTRARVSSDTLERLHREKQALRLD